MRPFARSRSRLLGGSTLAFLIASAALAKVETWRHEGVSAFSKGHREGVVISDSGRVRLAQAIRPTASLAAVRVWDLARTRDGAAFAATGNEGKVYRREGTSDWSVAMDSADSQALSLVVTSDGKVFVGTGPSGSLVEVTDLKHPASQPDPKVQYLWDLAADSKGNLYAATGPTGQLWKRSADGAWSLLLDSKHPHLLCVAVGPDGSIYAGSDGEGLIYKVGPDGKTSVVYDAPQNEVRALHVAPDGSIYAGTAAESGSPGGPGRSSSGFGPGTSFSRPPSPEPLDAVAVQKGASPPRDFSDSPSMPGGTAAPRPASPGENAVYRIGVDGVPREVFRTKALIFALAWRDDRLYVGTGPEGTLFEVRDLGRESSPVARLDHGQVLALLDDPKEGLLIGAGDPGAVLRLDPGHISSGTLTSDILDAKLVSKFGAVSWKAETPAGSSVSVKVRTGNVGEPDATWSPWSTEQTMADSASAGTPPGRFAQYRVSLATTNPAATPELRSLSIRYQTTNLPPEIARIDVPDVGAADGATRQARMTLRWEATDPNGDDLAYSLQIRKDGWPGWIKLGDDSLTESNFAWDTSAVPDGTYRVRVTASDRLSNAPTDALSRERVSDPFLVDHQPPSVKVSAGDPSGRPKASVAIKDDLTRIVKAAYSIDGGEWVPIFPDDGLFDSPSETISLPLPDLKPGTHVLMVRATDAAGNLGTGDLVISGR
jgi:hypothetical protein